MAIAFVTPPATQSDSPFFEILPTEIRCQIYIQLSPPGERKLPTIGFDPEPDGKSSPETDKPELTILRACQQTYHEASQVFYNGTIVTISRISILFPKLTWRFNPLRSVGKELYHSIHNRVSFDPASDSYDSDVDDDLIKEKWRGLMYPHVFARFRDVKVILTLGINDLACTIDCMIFKAEPSNWDLGFQLSVFEFLLARTKIVVDIVWILGLILDIKRLEIQCATHIPIVNHTPGSGGSWAYFDDDISAPLRDLRMVLETGQDTLLRSGILEKFSELGNVEQVEMRFMVLEPFAKGGDGLRILDAKGWAMVEGILERIRENYKGRLFKLDGSH